MRDLGPNEQQHDRNPGPNEMGQVPENIGAGEGNRTLVFSLEGCCSTIELHPRSAADQLSRSACRLNLRLNLRFNLSWPRGFL
jgi:hypothetical protein